MSDYSVSPLDLLVANQQKGYVGLHIEQGVPLLDRDLNLLHDLLAATVRSVVTRYIGNGIAAGADGFAITALPAGQNSQNFRIAAAGANPGSCLVGGIEVTIPADTTYTDQPGKPVPDLTTPTNVQEDPRTDIVYLDVFLIEVDGTKDPDLTNSHDVGMQTSVRLQPNWVVRVAEGVPVPAAGAGHIHYPLAQVKRPRGNATIDAMMITDQRQARLTVSDMERRLSLMERLLMPGFTNPPTQFLPKSGPIGQNITLIGTNFNVGTVQVHFDNIAASIVGAPSATQIVVKVPPGLTPMGTPRGVKIKVTNSIGSDTSDDNFTAMAAPAFDEPGRQFAPNHGLPGQQITIKGFNFNAANPQVQIGGVAATLVGTPTANQITVQIPAGIVPQGSTSIDVKIIVTTIAGTATSEDSLRAEINIPAPAFVAPPTAQFLPKSGPGGQSITVIGQNFNFAPVTVKFDTTTAIVIGNPSQTQIATVVPAGMIAQGDQPKGVKITVTTAGGSVVSADTFTVTGP
jgi:hypothetical protein